MYVLFPFVKVYVCFVVHLRFGGLCLDPFLVPDKHMRIYRQALLNPPILFLMRFIFKEHLMHPLVVLAVYSRSCLQCFD